MALSEQEKEQLRQRLLSTGLNESQVAAAINRKEQQAASMESPIANNQPTATQEEPEDQPGQNKNLRQKISDFLFPRASQFKRDVAGTLKLRGNLPQVEEESVKLFEQAAELTRQASQEQDPNKKRDLLAQSKQLNDQARANVDQTLTEFETETGLDLNKEYEDQRGSYSAQAAGVAGEVATYIIPYGAVSKTIKGTGIVARSLRLAAPGAITGGIYGATTPEDLTLGERTDKAVKGAAVGGAISLATGAAFNALREPAKNFVKGNKARINQLFRITPSERAQFRKSTGDMDFAEEILIREAKEMAGKDYDELLTHFASRKKEAHQAAQKLLKNKKETIPKAQIEQEIKDMMANLAPEEGNVGQGEAVKAFQGILDDLAGNPDELSLATANKIKSQLQNKGSAAFSPAGKATPASNAYATASGYIKDLIEEAVPDVKEANRLTQLYHQAKISIERTGDREANKISNDIVQKFLQQLPVTASVAAGIGGTAVAGPGVGIGALIATQILSGAAGAARVKWLTPQVQSNVIATLEPIARSQGVKNADKVVQRIVQELSLIATRNATSSIETAQGPMSEAPTPQTPAPQSSPLQTPAPPATGAAPTGQPTTPPVPQNETIQIRNKRTGEVRSVPRSQLDTFGLGDSPEGTAGLLPGKEEILASMFLDLQQTGGKNFSLLNTLLTAHEKVYKESTLSAQEKAAMAEATKGLNLLGEIENSYAELQSLGLTAQSGGVLERTKGSITGNMAAISQEGEKGAAAAAYANTIEAFMSRIARAAGEKGILTDQDIARIRKVIPKFSDSPETAARQFATIESIIAGAIETRGENPIGDRTAGLEDERESN